MICFLSLVTLLGFLTVVAAAEYMERTAPEGGEKAVSALPQAAAPSIEPIVPEETLPEPESGEVFEEYDITLMALGDNLMHMGIVYTGRQDDGSYDYSCLFKDMSDFLGAADIRVINQETIFGGNERGFSGYPYFNSPTQVGDAIAAAGFNVVLHATNHAADQGIQGIENCCAFWEQYPEVVVTGISPGEGSRSPEETSGEESAAGVSDRIAYMTVKDKTFAVLNYTYGPNSGVVDRELQDRLNVLCAYNEESGAIDYTSLNPQVLEDIREADRKADMVLVFPHWGTEYSTVPSSYQEKFAQEMADAGADLIVGTHPHVPQPVVWLQAGDGHKTLCYYSLGNYVSTQKNADSMLEEMAWVTFHVTETDMYIDADQSGALPLVCHYKSGPVRLVGVYPLEDYTEEMAQNHGIRNYGGIALRLEDLQQESREILGGMQLDKSDILK